MVTMLLTLSSAASAQIRPQDPKPPFPYQSVEVSYKNSEVQGVRLGGTLVIPAGQYVPADISMDAILYKL